MSKFFRSSSSQSTSSSSSSNSECTEDEFTEAAPQIEQANPGALDVAHYTAPAQPTSVPANTEFHKDFLLHALLEKNCLDDVRAEHLRAGHEISETEIRCEARERYRVQSQKLSLLGLVAPGLEGEDHEARRQQYRDGLSALSGGNAGSGLESRPPARRLLTDGRGDVDSLADFVDNLQIGNPVPPVLNHLVTQQSFLGNSRYRQDFDELGVLGKGGYGIVYQCRHKLDGVQYAVKKVPLSGSQQQRIVERGPLELDSFLSEVRTLAQLDHPNIVRYYNGWLEHTTLGVSESFPSIEKDTGSGADDQSLDRVRTESDSIGDNVLFEDSASRSSNAMRPSGPDSALSRRASRGTMATISDGDIESISRASDSSASVFTNTNGISFDPSTTQLVLHMQMALYPLSLTDFLAPLPPASDSSSPIQPLRHCFHHQPSLRILLALLDGLDYLHRRGICHRDIKPGNIFLAPTNKHTEHLVYSTDCPECSKAGQPTVPDLQVRIGDFGLVTALAKDGDNASTTSAPVGTELYRPSTADSRSFATPGLDLYALGVVAFELIWPFETRMERHQTLQALKAGDFPADFSEKVGDTSGDFEQCVREMLKPDGIDVGGIRGRLQALVR